MKWNKCSASLPPERLATSSSVFRHEHRDRRKTLTVALIGNPNTGKSTLFTALAGVRQRIGNYPGVTVEKKIGHLEFAGQRFALVDLPGTYSLAPRSPDEMVTVDVLLGRRADSPVRRGALHRRCQQSRAESVSGQPGAGAWVADRYRAEHDRRGGAARHEDRRQPVAERLGVPVVEVQANRRRGIEQLKTALAEVIGRPPRVAAKSVARGGARRGGEAWRR